MMTTSARSRSRRALAAVSSGSLALLALAAVSPAAEAVSPEIAYTCTVNGTSQTFNLRVVLDSTAPVRMTTGQSTQLSVTAKATLAKSDAVAIAGPSVNYVKGELKPTVTVGTAATTVTQTVQRTFLSEATVLSGASAPFTYTAPASPGALEVTAGGITGQLRFDQDGGPKTSKDFSCTAPNGKPPVIDTIAVAASTSTTLTLARTTSAYGQDVNASATVVSSSGSPVGDVAFAVDGIVTRAKVDKDGVASVVLPDAAVATHTIVATFVPSDVSMFVVSTSVTKLLTVSKAEAKVRVQATGRTTSTVTRVAAKVKGVFGTVPTGKVQIKVKRLGMPGKWVKSRSLDGAGAARIRLGKLDKGRYKAVVTYRGDTNHLDARKTMTFRVKPG